MGGYSYSPKLIIGSHSDKAFKLGSSCTTLRGYDSICRSEIRQFDEQPNPIIIIVVTRKTLNFINEDNTCTTSVKWSCVLRISWRIEIN